MEKWQLVILAIAVSAYLFSSYLFCYDVLLVLFGIVVGFGSALVLYDNKYVSILAHIISSKLTTLTDTSSTYDNDNILLNATLNTMWFNVGYWKQSEQNVPQLTKNAFIRACENMTSLLILAVGMSDGDTILDVGCGSGEQDFHIHKLFNKSKIVAVELSPMQIKYAKTKATMLEIPEDSMRFEVGDAVQLAKVLDKTEVKRYLNISPSYNLRSQPHPIFDIVIALDCAYHFQYRVDFLKQAHNFLREGGRIGLADICLAEGVAFEHLNIVKRLALKWMLRRMSVPPENLVDVHTYKQKLESCGFGNVTVTPITGHVFPGLLQFMDDVDARLGNVVKTYRLNKLRSVTSFLRKIISQKLLEYVIVSGVKIDK